MKDIIAQQNMRMKFGDLDYQGTLQLLKKKSPFGLIYDYKTRKDIYDHGMKREIGGNNFTLEENGEIIFRKRTPKHRSSIYGDSYCSELITQLIFLGIEKTGRVTITKF